MPALQGLIPAKQYRIILISAIVILLLRLLFIPLMGLMPQDAYYYFYAEHPALSYYDHPPAIAWLLELFTGIFGRKVFVLKLADTSITILTVFSFVRLASYFLSSARVQRAFLLFISTFLVTILCLVSTPDTPLILFWTLSLIALYEAIFRGKKWYWILSGVLMGLAFDSKYTALLLPAGLFLYLILSAEHRKLFLSSWLWIALALFVITISPVIIWNVQNHFASFRFQSANRMESMSSHQVNLKGFLGVLGHQSAILMPVLFFVLLWLLWKAIKKYKLHFYRLPSDKLFLLSFFLPLFAGFMSLSFFYWVKLNWMMPAYITGIIWASTWFKSKWLRYQYICSLSVHLLLALEVIFYPFTIKSDDTWVGWKQLASEVQVLKDYNPGSFVFSADDYKTSAALNFYLDEMTYSANVIGRPALQFDFVGTNLEALTGKDALYIDSNPQMKDDKKQQQNIYAALSGYFARITELNPILIKRNGKVVRKFLVYKCSNYNPARNQPTTNNQEPASSLTLLPSS